MIDEHVNNPKSPKYAVNHFFRNIKSEMKDKIVIDIPAGNGVTTEILLELGAKPEPFDLFPEYFMLKGIECKRADIIDKIPVTDNYADWIVCQEGIEHFSDQLKVFKEFNRILLIEGKLLITTPSHSNLSAKMSHLLFESETNRKMPPNEIDDIWMSDQALTKELYHGHIFLAGIQKLRILAKLSGFRIKELRYVRLSKSSLFLFPFFYPFILISSYLRYYKNLKRNKGILLQSKKDAYREQLKINTGPQTLLNHHTFIVFEKESELENIYFQMETIQKPFNEIM
jgi:SAM-dependent methyltransferase